MIELDHPALSITRQCALVSISRSSFYYGRRTSAPHPQRPIYKYLLRGRVITRPNQVWCADITYIPMRRGFLYLVAVMDWATRKVLSWRILAPHRRHDREP